ncbi:hypothetical protein ACLOJK_000769 [Asimina triloba]
MQFVKTTYENFRYRADNRFNVYNRGCLNNFLEVFCTKTKPSKNNFRAFIQQEPSRPIPRARETDVDDSAVADHRSKVEDDLEIGGDLLKISQRHNFEEVNEEIYSRSSNGPDNAASEADLPTGLDLQAQVARLEGHHSSRGRRGGSWEILPEILAMNSAVTENRGYT